jgi:hypothetical protein
MSVIFFETLLSRRMQNYINDIIYLSVCVFRSHKKMEIKLSHFAVLQHSSSIFYNQKGNNSLEKLLTWIMTCLNLPIMGIDLYNYSNQSIHVIQVLQGSIKSKDIKNVHFSVYNNYLATKIFMCNTTS